jgi:hypothetical protein
VPEHIECSNQDKVEHCNSDNNGKNLSDGNLRPCFCKKAQGVVRLWGMMKFLVGIKKIRLFLSVHGFWVKDFCPDNSAIQGPVKTGGIARVAGSAGLNDFIDQAVLVAVR